MVGSVHGDILPAIRKGKFGVIHRRDAENAEGRREIPQKVNKEIKEIRSQKWMHIFFCVLPLVS